MTLFTRLLAAALVSLAVGSQSPLAAQDPQPTPKLDRAQAEAAFTKLSAERDAAPPNTKERMEAAQRAMQTASDIAWMDFDAGKFAEASNWFARSAELKKDQELNARGYWDE